MSLLNKSFVFLFCLLCGCSKHVVTTNGTIDKTIQDEIISEYNALPDSLKSECKSVVLCDPDHFEYSEQEIVDGSYTKNNIALLVDSRTKSIKDYKSVMIHEIGHVIDLKYKYSSTEEFKQLYEENKIGYYDLGIHNTNEFFCEALSLYYTNPNELKNWNGDVYQYIQRLR
ncbi:anthrax toxin lethal factor-related metalloendopeptidase [Holdemanella sp.]|uniref:anthrax toxin lethal factor-related metalloendopeptidase n=1 Tax=Holdemanella sp. TaxID=1971762 RepID=UPI003AEF33C6